MPPMSIAGQPKSFRMSVTVRLAPASLPQMNISGGPPGKSGLNICAYPTVLKAFTTCAEGSHRCTCSPAESVCPTASSSPFGVKTRGLIASMTTLPAKFSAPASWMAFSAPAHDNASTITSPNFTASAKVPVDALIPEVEAHATAFSLCASRDPIFTSCPSAINPFPSARPTSPVPRIPIFMNLPPQGGAGSRPARCYITSLNYVVKLRRPSRRISQTRQHHSQHVLDAVGEDELHL